MTNEWTAAITVLGVFIANASIIIPLFLWIRGESRDDTRHMDTKLDANRELLREVHNETKSLIHSIQMEMKDFHNRLCKIEQERK